MCSLNYHMKNRALHLIFSYFLLFLREFKTRYFVFCFQDIFPLCYFLEIFETTFGDIWFASSLLMFFISISTDCWYQLLALSIGFMLLLINICSLVVFVKWFLKFSIHSLQKSASCKKWKGKKKKYFLLLEIHYQS